MRRKCFHPQAESKPAGGTSTADISDAPLIEAYAQKIVLGRKAMVIAGRASQEHLAPGGEYAEQKGIDDLEQAVADGMKEKSEEFLKNGGELYRKA